MGGEPGYHFLRAPDWICAVCLCVRCFVKVCEAPGVGVWVRGRVCVCLGMRLRWCASMWLSGQACICTSGIRADQASF